MNDSREPLSPNVWIGRTDIVFLSLDWRPRTIGDVLVQWLRPLRNGLENLLLEIGNVAEILASLFPAHRK